MRTEAVQSPAAKRSLGRSKCVRRIISKFVFSIYDERK
jgi:hypothetical protein